MTESELNQYLQVMTQCVHLAQQGQYTCLPNPQVGCMIVDEMFKVHAKGWHEASGQAHAEINALKNLNLNLNQKHQNLTVYVTLEPCCHEKNNFVHKKTPPCTDALIELKPKKVVVLMLDPNPHVAGKGVEKLKSAGIDVVVLENISEKLEKLERLKNLIKEYQWNNRYYLKYIQQQKPYITLKIATSLDGKIALNNGVSKWITGEKSRIEVQKIRASAQVIMTGMGTVLADNPLLNIRDEKLLELPFFKQPERWVWNNVFIHEHQHQFKQFNATSGAELYDLMCQNNKAHILIEGGSGINSLLLPWVDEIIWFQAPKIMGSGLSAFDKINYSVIPDNQWNIQQTTIFDEDICRWLVRK